MKEVVINVCYGGFSVSLKAVKLMEEKGCMWAKKILKETRTRELNRNDTRFSYLLGNSFDANIDRENPYLISAIKELGEEAYGTVGSMKTAKLKIVKIPDDVEYTIEEYDGFETIAETHRTWG